MLIANLDECPVCDASWIGKEIPEESREAYGNKTHFSLLIGVEYSYDNPERYDGISEWRCPSCGTRWGRWSGKQLEEGEIEPRFGGHR